MAGAPDQAGRIEALTAALRTAPVGGLTLPRLTELAGTGRTWTQAILGGLEERGAVHWSGTRYSLLPNVAIREALAALLVPAAKAAR